MSKTPVERPSFESKYDEILVIVEKQRSNWKFKASVMRDFDDVKSEIATHIWKKWHLYDPSRPLAHWVATIVKHKLTNLLRDIYLSTSSPCSKCPCNLGENVCSVFGVQDVTCPLYKKWYNTKRHIHQARLPLALADHEDEVSSMPDSNVDIERAAESLHKKMKTVLTDSEWAIYYRLFVLHKSEEETALELGFKTTEKGRKMGYKRIRQVAVIAKKFTRSFLIKHGMEGLANGE